ncbi:MAG: TIGR01212 family radical SAM protein [candidate division NC10 bacterium]|nr:TIGR01212 family radical SAM protein [candidate division NC10 bacterium]
MISAPVTQTKRYTDLRSFLQRRFGCRVHKIALDAHFTCPNLDGTKAVGGCIFCHQGSGHSTVGTLSISEQLQKGKAYLRRRHKAKKFLAYFQRYTNTYAPVEDLRRLYDEALAVEDVVGLVVGTRPDCVPDPILALLQEYAQRTYVSIEYGLQSIHDQTLARVNRAHGFSEFLDAVHRTAGRGIHTCVHVMLGLPGETKADMLATARAIARLPLDGIKIHLTYVLKHTVLGDMYLNEQYRPMEMMEYVERVCDFLDLLPPSMVIHRLTGDPPRDLLLAPQWARHKWQVLNAIQAALDRRDSFQGRKWVPDSSQ